MTRLEAEDRQGLPAATKNWEKAREDPPSPAAKTSEGAGPALISRFWPAEPQEGPHLFVSDHPVWCFVMAQRTHAHAPPQCQPEGSGGKQEGNAAGIPYCSLYLVITDVPSGEYLAAGFTYRHSVIT